MTDVVVEQLTRTYAEKPAIDRLDLSIESGQFVTLLGPSGCGKTTTLRCLAGLERPDGGRIAIAGEPVVDVARKVFVPPERRQVGMVFQSYALWPHMTVAENVAFPLKVASVPSAERRRRVDELLEAVGLAAMEDRPVTALSGGQQQRVALARALAARPRVVFYDEPLSNLDAKLRYQMGQQIRALHNAFESTSVYVTHDQEEAITLSDRIVVMDDGRIVQDGTPQALFDRPVSVYVADFMGFQNLLPGVVASVRGDSADVRLEGSSVVIAGVPTRPVARDQRVTVAFRSAHVNLASPGASGAGTFAGSVERVTYLGTALNLLIRSGELEVRVRLDTADIDRLEHSPQEGDILELSVGRNRAVVLEYAES